MVEKHFSPYTMAVYLVCSIVLLHDSVFAGPPLSLTHSPFLSLLVPLSCECDAVLVVIVFAINCFSSMSDDICYFLRVAYCRKVYSKPWCSHIVCVTFDLCIIERILSISFLLDYIVLVLHL